MKNESISTKKIVMTAFFAAIIYLGIQSFRIPLPAAVGTPFLHFGHIFVMLAVLMLGPKLSTVAGVLGLLVFDVLNGYIQAIPNVFVSTIIKCLLVGMIFQSLKKKAQGDEKKEYGYAVLCAAIYGVTNIIVDLSGQQLSWLFSEVPGVQRWQQRLHLSRLRSSMQDSQ